MPLFGEPYKVKGADVVTVQYHNSTVCISTTMCEEQLNAPAASWLLAQNIKHIYCPVINDQVECNKYAKGLLQQLLLMEKQWDKMENVWFGFRGQSKRRIFAACMQINILLANGKLNVM